jgi:hypothetical protein
MKGFVMEKLERRVQRLHDKVDGLLAVNIVVIALLIKVLLMLGLKWV